MSEPFPCSIELLNVLHHHGVKGSEFAVLYAIEILIQESNSFNFSHKEIAKIAGISVRSVVRHLDSLNKKGIVKWKSNYTSEGSRVSNTYRFVPLPV